MPEIVYGFFCEDTRVERSGQITAVGMWGGGVEFPSFPWTLRSIALNVYVKNREQLPFAFTVALEGPGIPPGIVSHRGTLAFENTGRPGHFIGLIVGPLMIAAEGTLSATLRIDSEPPVEQTFRLEIGQTLTQQVLPGLPGASPPEAPPNG